MFKVLISACLLGEPVRYNGTSKRTVSDILESWQKAGRVISTCPEVAGGMPVPRRRAEIDGGDGADVLQGNTFVVDDCGVDVSTEFIAGANKVLKTAKNVKVALAVLKEGSPSCGSNTIYNGKFNGIRVTGMGVTARLLQKNGVPVFNEHQFREADLFLKGLEDGQKSQS
ncbi:MAG: DUF523 domain-containing protein [SAR324 cluster bacterium]|nr:DUF523 domain-containing protein [SAR324 cluster bacterium]